MTNKVHWDKEQREYAKETNRTLCAVAIDGCHVKGGVTGRYEQSGPLPDKLARKIFFFAAKVWNDWEKSLDKKTERKVEAKVRKRVYEEAK